MSGGLKPPISLGSVQYHAKSASGMHKSSHADESKGEYPRQTMLGLNVYRHRKATLNQKDGWQPSSLRYDTRLYPILVYSEFGTIH